MLSDAVLKRLAHLPSCPYSSLGLQDLEAEIANKYFIIYLQMSLAAPPMGPLSGLRNAGRATYDCTTS